MWNVCGLLNMLPHLAHNATRRHKYQLITFYNELGVHTKQANTKMDIC